MNSSAESNLIVQFQNLTGADPETSKFFLESSGWQMELATEMYYESGTTSSGQSVQAHQQVHKPQVPAERPTVPQPSTSTARPRQPASSAPKRGNVVGLSDFASSEQQGQDYYTGGERSGIVVRDPTDKDSKSHDIVDQLMENAKRNGGVPPEPQAPQPKPSFTGSGYRLGDESRPSTKIVANTEAPVDKQGPITITFYSKGFTVDDGPLRLYDDPANEGFISDINRGVAPAELEAKSRGQPLSVNLIDKKHEDYTPPPKVHKPFSGAGYKLGGTTDAAASLGTMSAVKTTTTTARRQLVVDESLPFTTLQIRLHDGTRLIARFNHTHTIGDIRNFVNSAQPGHHARYVLQTSLPVRQLTDESQTIADAGLLNAVIAQKLV